MEMFIDFSGETENRDSKDQFYYGRLLKFKELRSLSDWPFSKGDDDFCLKSVPDSAGSPNTNSENGDLPGNLFFVSHRWLSLSHPDPKKKKINILHNQYDELLRLSAEIQSIPTNKITRQKQIELLEKRALVPLMPIQHFNEWPDQRAGFIWSGDGELAPINFLHWYLESINNVINGYVWIDSYALPSRDHRATCSYCRDFYQRILYRIPHLIARSTCLFMNGFSHDEDKRGWLLFESTVASMHTNLIQIHKKWNMKTIRERFMNLDYICTDETDNVTLPSIFGISMIDSHLKNLNQSFSSISSPIEETFFRDRIAEAIESVQARGETSAISMFKSLLLILGDPKIVGSILRHGRGLGLYAGQLYMFAITWSAFSVLMPVLRSRGISMYQDVRTASLDPVTLMQACIFYAICYAKMDASQAAVHIISNWQELMNLSVDYFRIDDNIKSTEKECILLLHEVWKSGNLINITHFDFSSLQHIKRSLYYSSNNDKKNFYDFILFRFSSAG